MLASLNHPNIGSIYGFEEDEPEGGKVRALVLELIEGPTLADRIAQGPIPLDEALPVAAQIAEALEAAHEQGIIHRDLKPANIKVKPDGSVKVLDFGLAKALDPSYVAQGFNPASASPTISITAAATQMGMVIGTAAYMSPEQARGNPVDKRADIWAFGVVLYEMLTGARPFQGEDVSLTLALVMKSDVDAKTLPTDLPPAVRTVLRRCLEKDPSQRIRDVGDVRLAMAGAFELTVAAPAGVAAASALRLWQRPVPVLLAVVLAALAAGLSVWGLRPSEPRAVTRIAYDLPPSHQLRVTSRQVLAVSPDGRRFVYNTADGLYLRSLDAFEPRLLAGTEDTLGLPFFSPDGQAVAFIQGNQIRRLALSGGAPVSVGPAAERPFGASWAPDSTILFEQPDGIMRVPANGGAPELIIPAEEGEVLDTPQLLPDGETVLFSVTAITSGGGGGGADRWDAGQIVAQPLTSGERIVLLDGGSDARYVPTGHLVYALDDGLFAVAFDVDTLTVVSGPVSMVEGVTRARSAASANYAVSDDGTLFYLAGDAGSDSRLVWVDRAGRVEPIETIPSNEYGSPRLSPDGDRLLIVAEGDLRVYDLASGRESRLTTDGATGTYAAWSPTGTEVAYTSSRGATSQDVWIQPADGSGTARQLTALEGRVHFDDWAPDGRTFTAHHHGSESNDQLVVSLDAADTEPAVWLGRESTDTNAVFSPDGRYVAYVSDQTGQREIHIQPFPGPGAELTVSVGGGAEPAWAANGDLFYLRPSDSVMIAIEISTDPELAIGPPTELFVRSPPIGGGGPRARYTVTADGHRFLMNAAQLPSAGAGGRTHARERRVQLGGRAEGTGASAVGAGDAHSEAASAMTNRLE